MGQWAEPARNKNQKFHFHNLSQLKSQRRCSVTSWVDVNLTVYGNKFCFVLSIVDVKVESVRTSSCRFSLITMAKPKRVANCTFRSANRIKFNCWPQHKCDGLTLTWYLCRMWMTSQLRKGKAESGLELLLITQLTKPALFYHRHWFNWYTGNSLTTTTNINASLHEEIISEATHRLMKSEMIR